MDPFEILTWGSENLLFERNCSIIRGHNLKRL